MRHLLYFLCPKCGWEDSLVGRSCRHCGLPIAFLGLDLVAGETRFTPSSYYRWLEEHLTMAAPSGTTSPAGTNPANLLRRSGPAVLYQFTRLITCVGYRHWFRRPLALPEKLAGGRFLLLADEARFHAEDGRTWRWPLEDFTCVTTDGHYFQFKVQGDPAYQIRFGQESPLKYELIFRRWLAAYYQRQGKCPVEFQPRLRFHHPRPPGFLQGAREVARFTAPLLERLLLQGMGLLVRLFLSPWLRVQITGRENWHRGMPGVVIGNHQSALDPFLLGAYVDPEVCFLTKSSSFAHALSRLFLRMVRALPTTRYQIDPPVVRAVRALLSRGQRVGIFPEGERTWDGRLRPFKLGTVRLLMALRQPIIPVYIQGAFDFWPRWRTFPRRAHVHLHIGAPFCLLPRQPVADQQAFLKNLFLQHTGKA